MTKPEWLPREIYVPVSEAEKDAVRVAQRVLRLVPTGTMDEDTRAGLRGLQRLCNIQVSGLLDTATAEVLDRLRPWRLKEDEDEAEQGHDPAVPVDGP